MDFTLNKFKNLLVTLKQNNLNSISFSNISFYNKAFFLRHDVDRLPFNSLKVAIIEDEIGLNGTYYFRIVPESYDLLVMERIAKLGHEIGYHYEDVDLVVRDQKSEVRNQKGEIIEGKLIDAAYESFCKNLEMLRNNFDIKTICMHGSPRAKYDNKMIWEKYSYKDLGLIGEPYYDIDFNEFAYFTDTGRRWNGHKYSIRDKVESKFNFDFKTTQDIIDNVDKLPDKVMITIHPERWTDDLFPWTQNLITQNIKNVVKRAIIKSL